MRTVQVGADRLERWVAGFASRHPGATSQPAEPGIPVELRAPDGSRAVLHPPFPAAAPEPADPDPPRNAATRPPDLPPTLAHDPKRDELGKPLDPARIAAGLLANGREPAVLRALLVRRGGYACAVVTGDRVTASKVGSRYVQGRTAAGGWSQQRFARRRDGQLHQLLVSATDVAARLLLPTGAQDALVTGGDRALIDRVLADPRLAPLRALRRGPHLEIADPRADLVQTLPQLARAIRIDLDEC